MPRGLTIILFLTLAIGLPIVVSPPVSTAEEKALQPVKASTGPKALIKSAYVKSKTARNQRDFAEIVYLLNRALRSDGLLPSHQKYASGLKGWAHNRLGEQLVERGREAAALGQFELAVKLNGDHWKARHNRGVSYAIAGQHGQALADFKAVIRIRPDFANGWFNRGEVYLEQGDLEAAIADYSEAIRLAPSDAAFYHARATALARGGKIERAADDLDRALRIKPDFVAAFVERGDIRVQQGKYEDAIDDYRSALHTDDKNGTAYRSLAWLMATCPVERFRDPQRGIAAAQKALVLLGENDHSSLEVLAAAQANDGKFPEAVAAQSRAVIVLRGLASKDQ
ncbi:MAG: tetratricopeptide repeat protein, partial [Planctomycetota bacterium]|nr:tetratricopeptide repeat protein [Planctomycetota bacterium]